MDAADQPAYRLMVPPEVSLDVKEQLKQAIDIVELVGSYVQLRRQGRIYVGLCPWHDDTKPSLQVNPERQSFKCWVCDIGGDVFSFIMKVEGVEFREALEILADRAGIPMRPRPKSQQPPAGGVDDKQTLYRAMAWAETQYHRCLLDSPEAEPARQYLQRRGITPESIDKFHLGFSPESWDWIVRQAEQSAQRTKILEAIGLVVRRDAGGVYDRFKGRLLFAIRDSQGRPVGFGGRVLPDVDSAGQAKYVNSPETMLFSKSNLVYGLDVARDAIRRSGTALVMEGYTDCIVAHQHGFDSAVAVLGTALGPRQIQVLKRQADRIVLVLDGDEAGQRRAGEVLELFVAQQVDLRILILPEGTDPCDFLQENGAEAFGRLLADEAVDALEHAFRVATRGVDLENDVHGSTRALERLISIVAKAPRPTGEARLREEKILNRLAGEFRIPEEDVRGRLTQLRRRRPLPDATGHAQQAQPTEVIRLEELNKTAPGQCELLEILVQHPELLPTAREVFRAEHLSLEPCRRIYETCCSLADAGTTPTFDRLMLVFDEPALKSLLVELDQSQRVKGVADPVTLLQELIKSFRRRETERRHPTQVAALKDQGLDESQKEDLLRKIMGELRARHGISDPTDG